MCCGTVHSGPHPAWCEGSVPHVVCLRLAGAHVLCCSLCCCATCLLPVDVVHFFCQIRMIDRGVEIPHEGAFSGMYYSQSVHPSLLHPHTEAVVYMCGDFSN